MPAVSKAQQRLMGAAEHGADFPMARKLRQSMTHEQLHDFASGSEKDKPEHIGHPHRNLGKYLHPKKGESMGRLSTKRRKALPKSDFAIPEKAPGPGSYPEPDKRHAVIAKGMAAMHASPAVRARVDAKANRILHRGESRSVAAHAAKWMPKRGR